MNSMDVTKAIESSHLSPKAVASQEVVLQAMKMVCCVYTKHFRNLYKTHKLQGGEDLDESVELIPCDPPDNFRR